MSRRAPILFASLQEFQQSSRTKGHMTRTEKEQALLSLAHKRRATQWGQYSNLASISGGVFDFDFVSPFTKTAGNVDSPILVMLQDWGSTDTFRGDANPDTVRLGYTPKVRTNVNLETRLLQHFGKSLHEVYATNLFPFIKRGGMSASIAWADLVTAAKEFALPQIEIVRPRLVIALGRYCYQALRSVAIGSAGPGRLAAAIADPFWYGDSCIYCQAHTGWGVAKRGREQTEKDWGAMDAWYSSEISPTSAVT